MNEPPVLFGELDATGQRIILVGQGDSWELRQLGLRLKHITPLISKAQGGALYIPATWAAVTQIAHSFSGNGDGSARWVPQPRLRQWITDEWTRRTAAPSPLVAEFPPWLALRPYQEEGAARIAAARRYLLTDEPGLGKAQPETTPVWTPDGWVQLGSLVPGDLVYNRYGQQVLVRKVHYQGEQQVWRVTFSDRTSTLASGPHLWRVWTKNDRTHTDRANHAHGRVLTTDQIREHGLHSADGAARYYLPQQPVLDSPDHGLPLDPYAYGALLGDGSLGTTGRSWRLSIACPDNEILFSVAAAATSLGTTWRWDTPPDRCQSLSFHRKGRLNETLSGLGALVYSKDKSIHPIYLRAGTTARRALLAGLLDTDGCVADGCAEFSSASWKLAADVAWLARSLGAVVTESDPQPAGYIREDGIRVDCLDKHRLHIRFPADGPNPFTLPRKADAWADMAAKVQRRNPPRTFQSIESAGRARVCCIELDTDDPYARVYLTDTSLIPTHNTATTIAGLMEMHCQHPRIVIFPCVIVVPSWNVADVWVREIATWAPGWTTALYGGPGRAVSGSDIYITTYATARLDAADASGPLVKLRPVTAIADEAHALKGNSTRQSLAFRRIAAHAGNVIALTGTPVTKDTGDVYPVLAAMDTASWPSRERFVRRYCQTTDTEYGETIEGLNKLAEPEFRAVLLGSMRRVAKADVLSQLPPKVYSVRRVEIPPEWRKAYDGMAEDMLAELPDGGELPVMETLAQMTRLSQLACSAADVEVTEEWDGQLQVMKTHYQVTLKAPSWKADALLGILAERRGQPVSVFAVSRQLIEIAGQACQEAGYRIGYITGAVPRRERAEAIEQFQAGKLDVILATTGAGGTGITLTAAGTAVFLQRPWSLAEALQAEDRQHRLGSERHEMVEIIDVVSKDTIDESVRAALKDKAGQLSAFIREPQLVRSLLGGIK